MKLQVRERLQENTDLSWLIKFNKILPHDQLIMIIIKTSHEAAWSLYIKSNRETLFELQRRILKLIL